MPAPLLYVSPTQVNALIPANVPLTVDVPSEDTPTNPVVPVVVTSSAGSTTYNIRITRVAPAIFTRDGNAGGKAILLDADFNVVDTVEAGNIVVFCVTGLGPTDDSGRVVGNVEVYVGERLAQVLYAGVAPGFPGVYQVNVMAPAPATDRLYIRTGGWQSNIATVGIRAGVNTANATGTIDGLYPSSDPGFPIGGILRQCSGQNDPGPCGPSGDSFSVMQHSGAFTVGFDILPTAHAFDVAAVGEAGGVLIAIDPVAGKYTASVTTLTPAATAGDFSSWMDSGQIIELWDYASCDWIKATCNRFPGNRVPLSRIDPYWGRASQMLPLPNMTDRGNVNAALQVSGTLSGSHFAVNNENNSGLAKFGGIIQIQYGPYVALTSTFKLYVDGKLVASKDIRYPVLYRGLARFSDDF
jgi:uncharacterized protein (TIGR03437 family)